MFLSVNGSCIVMVCRNTRMMFCCFLVLDFLVSTVLGVDDQRLQMMEKQLSEQTEMIKQFQSVVESQNIRLDTLHTKIKNQDLVIGEQSEEIKRLNRQILTVSRQNVKIRHLDILVGRQSAAIERLINQLDRVSSDFETVKQLYGNVNGAINASRSESNDDRTSLYSVGKQTSGVTRDSDDLKVVTKSGINRSSRLLLQPTQDPSGAVVAFYAFLSAPEQDPGHHHTVIFDAVQVNSGNGYNQHTGAFTAPADGYYVFSYTVVGYPKSILPVQLVCNSKIIGSIAADSQSDTPYPSSSSTIVIPLNRNDACFIRTTPNNNSIVGNIFSSEWSRSSFAGWKL